MIPNHPAGQVRRLTVEATRTRAPAADAAMTVPHIRGFPGPVRDGISSGIHDRPPNTRLWWQRRQRTGLESPIRYRCCDRSSPRGRMAYIVDFVNVSTTGLESSPVAGALAGLRANEARYHKNKYGHVFTVSPASDAPETLDWVNRILARERDIVISARPLEVTQFEVDGIRMAYVFYESGLSINVMYDIKDGAKRAVGFKLS